MRSSSMLRTKAAIDQRSLAGANWIWALLVQFPSSRCWGKYAKPMLRAPLYCVSAPTTN